MKQRGISLIVLIVTIIVIIILAAAVILTISKNNPVESAKEATFKEDVRTFQDELAMYIAKDYTAKAGQRDSKISTSNFSEIQGYIPSFSKKYERKFVIKNDTLVYNEDKLNENELNYVSSLNITKNVKTGAEIVEDSPSDEYYGKEVNYTAPNGVNDWKIFYSDGSNVYIISSEYVNPVVESPALPQLPSKNGVSLDQRDATNYPKAARFNNILSEYSTGSAGITDEKMKAFNSDYYEKEYTSGNNNNFKAVAYMLDKEIWSSLYANTTVAEYAVGGPSIEMLIKSYCIKHPECKDLYKTHASSATGYQVSNEGGKEGSWKDCISGMISSSDLLYVLPSSNKGSGADAMWLASPSAYIGNNVMNVYYGGYVGRDGYDNAHFGFRPLVCLNSNINLKWNEGTQKYDIE